MGTHRRNLIHSVGRGRVRRTGSWHLKQRCQGPGGAGKAKCAHAEGRAGGAESQEDGAAWAQAWRGAAMSPGGPSGWETAAGEWT